jgi:hypothetical protein
MKNRLRRTIEPSNLCRRSAPGALFHTLALHTIFEELARLAIGEHFEGLDRTIDAHVKNLRRKLGCDLVVI